MAAKKQPPKYKIVVPGKQQPLFRNTSSDAVRTMTDAWRRSGSRPTIYTWDQTQQQYIVQ